MWTDGGLGLEEYTESVIRTGKKPVGPRSSDGEALYTVAATESDHMALGSEKTYVALSSGRTTRRNGAKKCSNVRGLRNLGV